MSSSMTGIHRNIGIYPPETQGFAAYLDSPGVGTSFLSHDSRKQRQLGQTAPQGPALLAARILRRRGAGDRLGRAGAEALWRARLCPPRDRAQPLRGRKPQG